MTLDDEPDELTLTGYVEGRLLESERAEVERHLANSRASRELVAQLVAEREALQASEATGKPWRRWATAAGLVAAASWFALVNLPWSGTQDAGQEALRLGWAYQAENALATQRSSEPQGDEVFIGLHLPEQSWVRLIALPHEGSPMEVPLDPEGQTSLTFTGDSDHVFGPYALDFGPGSDWHALVAISSPQSIPWTELEALPWKLGEEAVQSDVRKREWNAKLQFLTVSLNR